PAGSAHWRDERADGKSRHAQLADVTPLNLLLPRTFESWFKYHSFQDPEWRAERIYFFLSGTTGADIISHLFIVREQGGCIPVLLTLARSCQLRILGDFVLHLPFKRLLK